VQLLVGARVVAKLTASILGTVTYMLDPATLKLAAGTHAVALDSMLIDVTGSLRVT
jgi:hypothetical protein